ncbi:DNA repair protein RecN [bacterium]|nr:DNA repair protein RecN [bacterium]
MISSIFIKNFILIDELNIVFDSGFNAICGETGAGKSIILRAIATVLGEKATKDVIKFGADKSLIEITFSAIGKLEVEEGEEIEVYEDEIVISREILQSSSKFRVNGVLVNADYVKNLAQKLIDIHSQHQTYAFLQKKYHINFLDEYIAGNSAEYKAKLEDFSASFAEYKKVVEKIASIESENAENIRKIEFLKFEIDEIERLALGESEEEELNSELEVLSNIQTLKEASYGAYYALNGEDNSIISALYKIEDLISQITSKDKSELEFVDNFYSGREYLKTCADELSYYSESLKDDPQRLDEINERLSEIEKLKRKYGNNLFEALENFKGELETLEGATFELSELQTRETFLKDKTQELSQYLTDKRTLWAENLSEQIVENLRNLELLHAQFKISVSPCAMNKNGIDDVEFLMSANANVPLSPIQKTASGGELSRIMLAIKTVFSGAGNLQTMIFDEIDTGISGKTSQAVAATIEKLSDSVQILAITHQPIIASRAGNIYWVEKTQNETGARVSVVKTPKENSEKLLAQLASGIVTQTSIDFAKDLLNN